MFHLAREGHRPSAMNELAKQASMVVTDLFPFRRGPPGFGPWPILRQVQRWRSTVIASFQCRCSAAQLIARSSSGTPPKMAKTTLATGLASA